MKTLLVILQKQAKGVKTVIPIRMESDLLGNPQKASVQQTLRVKEQNRSSLKKKKNVDSKDGK